MLRIGQVESSATADGTYTDGNVAGGIAATRLRAAAFNAIQEELAHIVESTGVDLDVNDMTQVLTALKSIFTVNTDSMGALAALVGADNKLPYFTGPKAAALADLTAFAREILAQTDAAGVLSKLGLGNLVNALIKTNNLSDLSDKAVSRTNLGVPKGVDKQMCNEWCVFNGVTTINMGDSLGISSVTRTGVGQYTINLSTPYPTTNYAVLGRWTSSTIDRDHELSVQNKTTSSFQLYCASDSSNLYPATDAVELSLSIWGAK
ncbi:hypothetical protein [Kluyvera ascorbata]|uniref:hypothetical protein n=1 Tax=Kluyvera ascorbata TaxID=51288 RepID=UPI0039F6D452